MTARDTQFAGFARALVDELMKVQHDDNTLQSEKIIAQGTYDLMQSIFEHHYGNEAPFKQEEIRRSIHMLPDLTELPKVSKWEELSKEQQNEIYSMKQSMWEKIMDDIAASCRRFPELQLTWILTVDVSLRTPTPATIRTMRFESDGKVYEERL